MNAHSQRSWHRYGALLVGALLCLAVTPAYANDAFAMRAVRTVVIDPGHGGEDPGAQGEHDSIEKDLTLRVAFMLRDALMVQDPNLRVVLTRTSDVYVPLESRTHLANEVAADLFVSIHFNFAANPGANGIETFYLEPVGDRPGDVVPGREHEGPALPRAEVGVGGDLRASVLQDLRREGLSIESAELAARVQRALISATGAQDRDVRQARFRVLRGAMMPAVVAELGFLTNSAEGERVLTQAYQQRLVHGLVDAVRGYDRWAARVNGPADDVHPTPAAPAQAVASLE